MKCVITGHKSGLGEALFLKLKYYRKDIDVVGFDLVDGHNISDLATIAKIVWKSKNADVFINNAYDAFGQTKLLEYFLKSWQFNSTKIIVNIGSFLLDENEPFSKDFNTNELEYLNEKRKQINLIDKNQKTDPYLKVIQVNPGLLETNFVQSLGGRLPENKLLQSTIQTADLIIKIIDSLQHGLYTKKITLINLSK